MDLKSTNRKILVTVGDLPFYTIFGAEGNEDDDKKKKANSDDTSGGDSGDDGDDDDGDDGDSGSAEKDTARRLRDTSKEAAQRRRDNREQKKEIDRLKLDLEEREKKDKSDLENYKADSEKKQDRINKMEKVLQTNILETAILKDSKFTWHDVTVLRAALDMGEIEVDVESGTVDGLSDELKRVAREKPFLLKGAKKDDGDGDQKDKKNGSSGNNPGGAGDRSKEQQVAERERLVQKYKL